MYYLLLTIKYTKIWKQFRHIMVSYMRMLFYRCRGTLSWTLICICVATVQHCRWQDMGQDIHKTWHHMLCSEIKGSSVCCFWGQKGRHVSARFFCKAHLNLNCCKCSSVLFGVYYYSCFTNKPHSQPLCMFPSFNKNPQCQHKIRTITKDQTHRSKVAKM